MIEEMEWKMSLHSKGHHRREEVSEAVVYCTEFGSHRWYSLFFQQIFIEHLQ